MSVEVKGLLKPILEPLLSICRELGSRHVSQFGSSVRQPLSAVSDVDLHVVIPRMNRGGLDALLFGAGEAGRKLAAQVGRPCHVEARHGPFKPVPGTGLQLHLLVDDEASLARLPCALIAQRAAAGQLWIGEPLAGRRADWASPEAWLREARVDTIRWRDALAAREIAFRAWELDPEPALVERRVAAETGWELRCLLQGAARSSDLQYRAALVICGLQVGELAIPLLAQIDEEPAWESLEGDWERLRDQALEVIERRLDHLCRWIEPLE